MWGQKVRQGIEIWRSVGYHYPTGRLLFDEFLSVLPHIFARALVFIAAIGSLFVTRDIWRAFAAKIKPAPPAVDFCASAGALILFARWVVRDLDDCGLQVLLLLVLSMGAWALYRAKWVQARAWVGLAVTYKLTPSLFLPLLLWKRRFVEAAAAIAFVIVFNLIAPALFWGRTRHGMPSFTTFSTIRGLCLSKILQKTASSLRRTAATV
jgi:Glycosyltransferase family 87